MCSYKNYKHRIISTRLRAISIDKKQKYIARPIELKRVVTTTCSRSVHYVYLLLCLLSERKKYSENSPVLIFEKHVVHYTIIFYK